MQSIKTIALFTLATIFGAGAALAQTHAVQATMPFDFTVGNRLLPPGTYKIVPVTDAVIEIQNNSNKKLAVLSQMSPDSTRSENGGNLVFDKFGDQYFLREVLGGPSALNVNLPSSKSEKRARTQEATVNNQIHALAVEPSQVFVPTSN
jgi:hypothetical protein